MNRIFRVVWNSSTNSWQAVSEFASSAKKTQSMKTAVVMVATLPVLMFADPVFAAEISSADAYKVQTTKLLIVGNNDTATDRDIGIGVGAGGNLTINSGGAGESVLTFNPTDRIAWNASGFGIHAWGGTTPRTITAEDNFTLNMQPSTSTTEKGVRIGVNSLWGGVITFNKNLTINHTNIASGGNFEHYAIGAGSSTDSADNLGWDTYSKVHIKGDLTAEVSGTDPSASNTLVGIRSIGGDKFDRSGKKTSSNASGDVTVDGKATITMTGEYAEGIYVSGGKSKVTLNSDSKVTMNNGLYGSAALKIGKSRDLNAQNKGRYAYGAGSGTLISKGNMELDTTNSDGAAIQIQESNSLFDANASTASVKIRSKAEALTIGALDWTTHNAADNIQVLVNNADWQSITDNMDLMKITEKQTNAVLTFTGDTTNLKASSQGWLLREDEDSTATFSLSDGRMTGLTYKDPTSTLEVTVKNSAIWSLNKNDTKTTALLDNLTLTNQAVLNGAYNVNGGNDYTVKAVLADGSKGTVTNNNSIINLVNTGSTPAYNDVLTLDSNYVATGSAIVRMNTLWNGPGDEAITTAEGGNDSSSDVLHILGTATGTTTVVPVKADGTTLKFIDGSLRNRGKETFNTVPVVIVEDDIGGGKFVGKAQMTHINEVQLTSRIDPTDTTGKRRQYYWTYKSNQNTDIILPFVPLAVQTPTINIEQGLTTLGSLHERRGDNFPMLWDACGCVNTQAIGQTWIRTYGSYLDSDGKYRFDSKTEQYGIQIGHDFRIKLDKENQSRHHTGAYLSYNRGKSNIYDRYRTVNGLVVADKYVGKLQADQFSLGLSHTAIAKTGRYIDYVAQIGLVKNHLTLRDGEKASQNGISGILSVEAGRPYSIGKYAKNETKWVLEPQAQLSYNLLHLGQTRFDENNVVSSANHHNLRARLGTRVSRYSQNGDFTNTFYGIANIYVDVLKKTTAKFGIENMDEKYSRVWGELGLGADLPVSKRGHIYADIKVQRNFDGIGRSNYTGSIGYKYTW